ncbi:hypothetical protein MMC12_001917 [Toensbergia leucococca]|nr:hypothetical protein [Toensbergia leucococca]
MSGLELLAIVGCVAAVTSAYHDGFELVQEIRAKRKAKRDLQRISSQESSTQELQESLYRGQEVVQSQYNHDFRRYGNAFRIGDDIARDALKDVIIHLQSQVISNLKIAWQQDTVVDFTTLQDASDFDQNRAIMILLQLQQRIICSAPIREIGQSYPSANLLNGASPPTSIGFPPSLSSSDFSPQNSSGFSPPLSTNSFPGPPARQTSATPSEIPTGDSISSMNKRPGNLAASMKKTLFRRPKIDKRCSRELDDSITAARPFSVNPTGQSQGAFLNREASLDSVRPETLSSQDSRFSSVSTGSDSLLEPDGLEWNPWSSPRSPSPSRRHHDAVPQAAGQRMSPRRESIISSSSTNSKAGLPGEANRFAGFCEGAWRLQIGNNKKAMGERQRPGGMFNKNSYWKCSKCDFEGRMVKDEQGRKSYDTRIFTAGGIQFRWEFLFKSHVYMRHNVSEPINLMASTFGCIFCCAEGKGTPTFGGAPSFIAHLQEHRDRPPTGEVLYRMKCSVGPAREDDEFHVNMIERFVEV